MNSQQEKDDRSNQTNCSGAFDWTIFKIVIPGFALAILILTLLEIPLKFEIETSPAWQISLYYLALGIFFSTVALIFRMETKVGQQQNSKNKHGTAPPGNRNSIYDFNHGRRGPGNPGPTNIWHHNDRSSIFHDRLGSYHSSNRRRSGRKGNHSLEAPRVFSTNIP